MRDGDHSLGLRVRALLGERRRSDSRAPFPPRPKPYVTLHVAGPLGGAVTLTAAGSGEIVVEASWGGGRRHRISATQLNERSALRLADTWADQLIDGHKPTRSPGLQG